MGLGGQQGSGHCPPPPTTLPRARPIPTDRHTPLLQGAACSWEQSGGGKWVHMPWVGRGPGRGFLWRERPSQEGSHLQRVE